MPERTKRGIGPASGQVLTRALSSQSQRYIWLAALLWAAPIGVRIRRPHIVIVPDTFRPESLTWTRPISVMMQKRGSCADEGGVIAGRASDFSCPSLPGVALCCRTIVDAVWHCAEWVSTGGIIRIAKCVDASGGNEQLVAARWTVRERPQSVTLTRICGVQPWLS